MSDDSQGGMEELPEDVQALLDTAAEIEPAPLHLSERVWSKLGSSIDGLGPLGALPDGEVASTASELAREAISQGASAAATGSAATATTATSALSISKLAAALWTASTFAVGTIAGAGTHAALTQPPEPPPPITQQLPTVSQGEDAGAEVVVVMDMGSMGDASSIDMSNVEELQDLGVVADVGKDAPIVRGDAGQRGERVASPPASIERSLEAERLLLSRAQRALSRGDGTEALDMIRQHERRFGRESKLAEEREFLRIRALLATGDRDSARTATSRFKKRYPGSIFLDALDGEKP